jgi:hypothetical protein
MIVLETCLIICDVVSAQVRDRKISATRLFRFKTESI